MLQKYPVENQLKLKEKAKILCAVIFFPIFFFFFNAQSFLHRLNNVWYMIVVVFNQQGKKKEGNVAAFAINVSQKRKYRSVYLQYLFSEIKYC